MPLTKLDSPVSLAVLTSSFNLCGRTFEYYPGPGLSFLILASLQFGTLDEKMLLPPCGLKVFLALLFTASYLSGPGLSVAGKVFS